MVLGWEGRKRSFPDCSEGKGIQVRRRSRRFSLIPKVGRFPGGGHVSENSRYWRNMAGYISKRLAESDMTE